MKNKIIIYILLISLINLNIKNSFGQTPILSIPVRDDTVTATIFNSAQDIITAIEANLSNIQTTLIDEFSKLNKNVADILVANINNRIDEIFNDITKKEHMLKFQNEIKFLVEKNTIKGPEDIQNDINEAKFKGVLIALKEIPKTVNCLSIEAKERLIQILEINNEFFNDDNFKVSFMESIDNIPYCESASIYGFANQQNFKKRKSFLAYFLRPFNFGLLAQINPSSPKEQNSDFSFVITPAIEESEATIQASAAAKAISNQINSSINKEITQRTNALGKVKPIEKCVEHTYSDSGRYICTKYETVADLNQFAGILKVDQPNSINPGIQQFAGNYLDKSELASNLDPLINSLFASNLEIPLTTSTTSTSTTSTIAEEEVQKILAKVASTTCKQFLPSHSESTGTATSTGTSGTESTSTETTSFTKSEKDTASLAQAIGYAKCLSYFGHKTLSYTENLKKEKKQLENGVNTNIDKLENIQKRIDEIKNLANQKGCSGIIDDLDLLKPEIENRINNYKLVQARVNVYVNLDRLYNQLFDSLNKFDNKVIPVMEDILREYVSGIMNELKAKIANYIATKINSLLKKIIAAITSGIVGTLVGTAIDLLNQITINKITLYVKSLTQSLAKYFQDKLSFFGGLIEISYNVYTSINSFWKMYDNFKKENISKSIIITDYNKLLYLEEKLTSYENYLNSIDKCKSAEFNENRNLIIKKENKFIVVKNLPQQNKWSIFNLANILNWKSFELNLNK